MKLAVEFPSVAFREGPAKVAELARAIEEIGYDELAVFDHVVMGYPTATRKPPMYPPQMPILEALVLLGFAAAVTERVSLSTEVLVLTHSEARLRHLWQAARRAVPERRWDAYYFATFAALDPARFGEDVWLDLEGGTYPLLHEDAYSTGAGDCGPAAPDAPSRSGEPV